MLTLIAGAILFFCSAYVGLTVKKHYKRRKEFFKELTDFCELAENEISFLKTPLKRIIETFTTDRKGEFIKFLRVYFAMIDEGKPITAAALSVCQSLKLLKPEEKGCVVSFFAALGKNDCGTELKNLENYRARFANFLADADKSYRTSGNLSFKLSVLLGIAVMIIVA